MLNERQVKFLIRTQLVSAKLQEVIKEAKELSEMYSEEFDTTQDNALDDSGVATELEERGINFTSINVAMSQGIANLVNFWDGNAVTTREYGKDIRRIAYSSKNI